MSSEYGERYDRAKEEFSAYGIDTDRIIDILAEKELSLHCWQGDDVVGFERRGGGPEDAGIMVTGSYPGRARTPEELRKDYLFAFSLIPGRHRANLHAIYGEFDSKPADRNEISEEHFENWLNWAKENGIGLDFNPTLFNHPKAAKGFTLSHPDPDIRNFWIEHVQKCRRIAEYFGRELGGPTVNNLWIPDGMKDIPVDRYGFRKRLLESLDRIYSEKFNRAYIKDSVEGKLFGIGSESFVVGSHEFYTGYVISRGDLLLCLDMGHFHPTENVGEKIPSLLLYIPELLIHVSRGVRWDSDHVVILNDELLGLMHEIVRADAIDRVILAPDFFDASINRIGAWVIGARATLKALMIALCEPVELLREAEMEGDYFRRLALMEELKMLPYGAVWDMLCVKCGVPPGNGWISAVIGYEKEVLSRRK